MNPRQESWSRVPQGSRSDARSAPLTTILRGFRIRRRRDGTICSTRAPALDLSRRPARAVGRRGPAARRRRRGPAGPKSGRRRLGARQVPVVRPAHQRAGSAALESARSTRGLYQDRRPAPARRARRALEDVEEVVTGAGRLARADAEAHVGFGAEEATLPATRSW